MTGNTPGTWPGRAGGDGVRAVRPGRGARGLCAAGTAWAWRIYALDTGLSGKTATAPVIFDARQWNRQARTARASITAPGASADRRAGADRDGRDDPRGRPPLAPDAGGAV